jgi:hypothetical protein
MFFFIKLRANMKSVFFNKIFLTEFHFLIMVTLSYSVTYSLCSNCKQFLLSVLEYQKITNPLIFMFLFCQKIIRGALR